MSQVLKPGQQPDLHASTLVLGRIELGPLTPTIVKEGGLPFVCTIQVGKYLCRCCPFCGSSDLCIAGWCDDDGEFDAIECCGCMGCAPADRWNQRALS